MTKKNSQPSSSRVAVIGCGYWGPNHVRNFHRVSGCEVTAVDTDPSRLEKIAREYPGVELEKDYRRVFADRHVDAVVIATPTSTHYQLTHQAMSAGKHVLCEKPLCMTGCEAAALVELAREKDLILMTGHVFLFNAGIQEVKRLIGHGELGELRYLCATRTSLGPIRSDVNAAYDLAAHDISIFNWILDAQPIEVSATGGAFVQPGIHDVVFVTLKYPQNRIAHIHASWLNPKKVRQITVVGSQRMVIWDDLKVGAPVAVYDRGANSQIEYGDYGEFLKISTWDGDVRLPKIEPSEPLNLQSRCFIDAIKTGVLDKSNGEFSLGVVRTLEMIGRSLRHGGAPFTKQEYNNATPPH